MPQRPCQKNVKQGSPPLLFPSSLIPFVDFINGRSLALCGRGVVNTRRPKNVVFFWAWESNSRSVTDGAESRKRTQVHVRSCLWQIRLLVKVQSERQSILSVAAAHTRVRMSDTCMYTKVSPFKRKTHTNTHKYSYVSEKNHTSPQITASTWRCVLSLNLCFVFETLKPEV